MDSIPAGNDYSLVVVVGSYTGTTLVPDQYGQSAPFAVVAGKSTSVKLTAQPVPFSSTALIGKDLKSVVFNSSVFAIYGVDGGNLYSMTGNVFFNPPGSFTQAPAPAGTTINSLTNLSNSVWVNTSTGILQADSWPASVYTPGPGGNIIQSGMISGTAFYRTPRRFRRRNQPGGNNAPSWFTVDMTDGAVVQPVLDLTVSQGGDIDFGCFASGAGVFALGTDPLLAANPNLSYIRQTGAFVRVLNGGKNVFVTSVGLDDVSYPTDLYLGTVNGVYTTPVGPVTSLIGSGNTLTVTSAPLPLTSGHPFRKVTAVSYSSATVIPLYAALSNNMIVGTSFDGITVNPFSYPVPAVTLGTPNSISIVSDASSNVYLYIAGSEGLTVIPLVTIQLPS